MTLTPLATPPTDAKLIAATEEIVPLLRDQAQQGERDRRLTEPVVEALTSIGVTRMSMPKRFGGLEADLPTQVEVFRSKALTALLVKPEQPSHRGWPSICGRLGRGE